jgi:hypothetical protein
VTDAYARKAFGRAQIYIRACRKRFRTLLKKGISKEFLVPTFPETSRLCKGVIMHLVIKNITVMISLIFIAGNHNKPGCVPD